MSDQDKRYNVTGTQKVDVTISEQEIKNLIAQGCLPFQDVFWALQQRLPERFGLKKDSFIDNDGDWISETMFGYQKTRAATKEEVGIYNDLDNIRQAFFKMKFLGESITPE